MTITAKQVREYTQAAKDIGVTISAETNLRDKRANIYILTHGPDVVRVNGSGGSWGIVLVRRDGVSIDLHRQEYIDNRFDAIMYGLTVLGRALEINRIECERLLEKAASLRASADRCVEIHKGLIDALFRTEVDPAPIEVEKERRILATPIEPSHHRVDP